jgi:hypothetical protein
MVGCFQRKSTGENMSVESRTGVFLEKSSKDYVVIWRNREICRYGSIEAFVESHLEGIRALEADQADLLEQYYKSPQ